MWVPSSKNRQALLWATSAVSNSWSWHVKGGSDRLAWGAFSKARIWCLCSISPCATGMSCAKCKQFCSRRSCNRRSWKQRPSSPRLNLRLFATAALESSLSQIPRALNDWQLRKFIKNTLGTESEGAIVFCKGSCSIDDYLEASDPVKKFSEILCQRKSICCTKQHSATWIYTTGNHTEFVLMMLSKTLQCQENHKKGLNTLSKHLSTCGNISVGLCNYGITPRMWAGSGRPIISTATYIPRVRRIEQMVILIKWFWADGMLQWHVSYDILWALHGVTNPIICSDDWQTYRPLVGSMGDITLQQVLH